jgi:adsorption protein B
MLEQWVVVCLAPLAVWALLSGIDDLFVALVLVSHRWLPARRRAPYAHWPSEEDLNTAPRKRIAIFIPLWREHRVIGKMLEHNLSADRYRHCDFFAGAYPNDPETIRVVAEVQRRHRNLHVAVCPHPGPTSKADCLNWIFQRMRLYEENHGCHFDIVVTHDAEDLIHPESLRLINYFSETYGMVQIPVLPLPTPMQEVTHGIYCDDFAEFQSKDIPVRQILGGFIPSNGVGTGYSRSALEKLAARHANRLFDPACLTEDYENGYRICTMNLPQIFVPLRRSGSGWIATREYFPRTFRAAIRQRTRWITGIVLQGWQRHGWRAPAKQVYWLWRDRKGLVGNLLSPLLNILFVYGVATWAASRYLGRPWSIGAHMSPGLSWLLWFTMMISWTQLAVRAVCVAWIYGWRYALGVPARTLACNWLNGAATLLAILQFARATLRGMPLAWIKTDHSYPSLEILRPHKRRIGEILIACQYVSATDLADALASQPPGRRIGEHLIALGKLDVAQLYEALGMQHGLPAGRPNRIARPVTRALPAAVARKWSVLPCEVSSGSLLLASPEALSEEMASDLRRFSPLDIRMQLVPPEEFEELLREYLP